MSVHDGDHIFYPVPAVQRLLPQSVKKFIHIENAGGLHQHPVVTAHAHRDKLRLEASPVTVLIAAPGNHLQLAMLSLQILEQHHVHVNCTEIILQNPDIFPFSHKVLRIISDKRRLPGPQKAGDQIDLYHFSVLSIPSV